MSYPLKFFITDFFFWKKITVFWFLLKLKNWPEETQRGRWLGGRLYIDDLRHPLAKLIYWKYRGETTQYYHRKELILLFQLHLDIRLDYFLLITIGLLNQIAVRTLRLMLTMYFACTRATVPLMGTLSQLWHVIL